MTPFKTLTFLFMKHILYCGDIMDTYRETTIDKKRLLVPLIVLLMSTIALTGCAFAYAQSYVNVEDNPIDGEYYTLDYTNNLGVAIDDKLIGENDIAVYTEITVSDDPLDSFARIRDFKAYIGAGSFTRTFYVTLHTDMGDSRTFDLSGTCDATEESVLSQFITATSFAYEYDSAPVTTIKNGETVKVTVTFTVARTLVNDMTGVSPVGDNLLDYTDLVDTIADICTHTFSVNVSAVPTA